MESQQIAPRDYQSVEGEVEDGQHHEKKSVLKKVKAKAKKIKDTITKHGHPHDHDRHYDYDYDDDYDDGDDGDEDEVVVEDPQLQGAPLYEGAAMRSGVGRQGHQQDVGIGIPTTMHNEPLPASRETTSRPSAVETGYTTSTTTINKPTSKLVNSAVEPNTSMSMSTWSLVEDPHAPMAETRPHKSEVKALDPLGKGSEEAGESQMFDSFAKMKVNEEDKPNQTETNIAPDAHRAGNQSSYAQKISAVGSTMSGKAVAAKDFMASKLGLGETTEHNANTTTKSTSSALEYGKKIALTMTEKLKPGEEDRALSNVISEALNRGKEEQQHQASKVGKVTESDDLTRRLGRENEGKERSGTVSTAVRSVADTVKDTIGSWMGHVGDQPPPSQQSLGTPQVEGLKDSSRAASRPKPGETEAEVQRSPN